MALSRTRLRATHSASCSERLISSRIILLPPRTNSVTARELGQPSMTSMRSLVVPNDISRTTAALRAAPRGLAGARLRARPRRGQG
jgi:hypothetical protein